MPAHDIRDAFERHCTLFNARRRAEWLDKLRRAPVFRRTCRHASRYRREHFANTMDRLVADGINAVINPPLRVIANGDGFAVHFTVDVPLPGGAIHEDIIEIFKIVADGHVEGVRAFVTPRAMAPIS